MAFGLHRSPSLGVGSVSVGEGGTIIIRSHVIQKNALTMALGLHRSPSLGVGSVLGVGEGGTEGSSVGEECTIGWRFGWGLYN
mgnify:CR=1 FL=1